MAELVIADATPRTQIVIGGTATTGPHNIGWPFLNLTDVIVYDGVTKLTYGTDYTVAGVAVTSGFSGGTVSTVAAKSNTTLTFVRKTAIQRSTDFPRTGNFDTDQLNKELDAQTAMIQEVRDRTDRSLVLPETVSTNFNPTLPLPQPGYFLGWAGDGLSLINSLAANAAVSVAMLPVVSAASLDNAIAALLQADAADAGNSVVVSPTGVPRLSGPLHGWKNGITNPYGLVNQYGVKALSTSFQYFVDRWAIAAGAAVTGGNTFASANVGFESQQYFGTTISTTPVNSVSFRHRIEAAEAQRFASAVIAARRASLRFKAVQNTGSARGVTVTINKANAADNFSAVTNIATIPLGAVLLSSALSAPTDFFGLVALENLNLGDCRNGLEIIVQIDVPAGAAGATIGVGDFQLQEGPVATHLEQRPLWLEKLACYRRHYEWNGEGITSAVLGIGMAFSTSVCELTLELPVEMAGTPTVSVSAAGDISCNDGTVLNACTGVVISAAVNSSRKRVHLALTQAATLTVGRAVRVYGTTASGAAPRIIFDKEL